MNKKTLMEKNPCKKSISRNVRNRQFRKNESSKKKEEVTTMSNNPMYWTRSHFNRGSIWCNAILEAKKGFIVAGNAGDPGSFYMSSAFLVVKR